ncbi:chemotaxis protein CheW [Turneriella parva]|uniref:CheW protein n=1 Tax=Turneriella parva (strain ATCC BAA-1111 / DSM 21527 / NCTC 11395 / H) TaxID=869212 RepID=I4BB39_TURPD|nr:chemotaxis protein CheW [Turneriella parva]AFM14496.1 CheW protein [Turneriella parva DSM 21527]
MTNTVTEYLRWTSGAYLFGLELAHCREIVNDVQLTRLPRSPAFVRGLANLRGTVITVIDLEVLLGYRKEAAFTEFCNIIRLRVQGYPIAVVADAINDTAFLGADELERPPANLTESESNFIRKVAKTKDGLVLVPDLHSIASRIN